MRVVAHTRRSTRRQAASRAAQLRRIREEAERRGWLLVAVEGDTASGGSRRRRPGLAAATEACRSGRADAIVVARLDRLVRSIADFGLLIEDAREHGYAIVVLDHAIDTGTANGRLVANVLASVAAWEREIISERTREAAAARRAEGDPRQVPPAERARILELWTAGRTQPAIAAEVGRHRESVVRVLRAELGRPRGRLVRTA